MPQPTESTEKEILLADLSRLPWVKGICSEAITELSDVSEFIRVNEGEIVHRAGDTLTAVYFVTRGRLRASVVDLFGKQVLEKDLIRGGCFGLFSVAQPEDSVVNITSLEPTSLLKLSFEQLHRLSAKYPDLQMSLFRLAGNIVRQIVMVDRAKAKPSAVSVIHQSPASRSLTRRLVERLSKIENTPCVCSDDPNWQPIEGVAFRSFIEDGQPINVEQSRQQLKEWADLGRIFLDLSADLIMDALIRAMQFSDSVLWCLQPADVDAATKIIRRLQETVAGWREKICLVWLLHGEQYVAPFAPQLTSMIDRTFKISFDKPVQNQGNLLHAGIERIVHYLRGVRIGIALGGGAARGMAHLGVLKALEQNGIHIDMIAGTSAGAMTGTVYAYGLEADFAVQSFKHDLRLPWFYRRIPGGGYWYLLSKYRRGKFDPMLRKYLGDAPGLEQLAIPTYTVTVDLVKGLPVVRETGDAVRGIIESINLPGLASPIWGDREALVDGGLINNIPADVLVAKGCNFVIASSVTARLEQTFGGVRADDDSQGKRKKPSTLQVILRGQMVQGADMNAVGVKPADCVIEPDVTGFDLSEFERTDELADVGHRTALEATAGIKGLLSKLDDKLFPTG